MPYEPSLRKLPSWRLRCEVVEFAEVEIPRPVCPRLVVRFSRGLSLLLEDEQAVGLATEFIAAFCAAEKGGRS